MEPVAATEHMDMHLSPRTLHVLQPLVQGAAEAEWESGQAQAELQNLANEITARLQRVARGE